MCFRIEVDDDEAGIVLGVAQPLMQDFSFNSFIWTNLDSPASGQFWITCDICLCNSAADDVTCPDVSLFCDYSSASKKQA